MQLILDLQGIQRDSRPTRRNNNTTVIVKSTNRRLKVIVRRLDSEEWDETDVTVLNRSTLLFNKVLGSKLLSASKISRGYAPSC